MAMPRGGRFVLVTSMVTCLLAAGAAPAGADVPPYAESNVGASHEARVDSIPGTATASSDASAAAATGTLAVSGQAADTFPIGRVVSPTISYATGFGSAWVKLTRTLAPGDYVVTAKFSSARASLTRQTGIIGTLPNGSLVQYAGSYARTYLNGSCAGCSVSSTQYWNLDGTPRSATLVLAVTVPAGLDVTFTAKANLDGSAYVSGEGSASVEASAILQKFSIFRGEEEV